MMRMMHRSGQTMNMTEGSIWRSLLVFFFPLMAGTFFQMLYNTVDTLIVGRFVGTTALSAVGGAAAALMNLFVGFFVGISSGASVLAAQCYGAKRWSRLHDAVHTAMALAGAMGLGLTVLAFVFAAPLLALMRTPADSFEASLLYLRIISAGMLPNMVYNMGAGIFRALGDSKRPFYFLVFGAGMNILLDLLFVAAMRFGVAGAATATVLSQLSSALLVLYVMMRGSRRTERVYKGSRSGLRDGNIQVGGGQSAVKRGEEEKGAEGGKDAEGTKTANDTAESMTESIPEDAYRLTLCVQGFHGPSLRKILQIGIPTALQSMMYNLSNAFIQSYVNDLGTATVAAWGISGKVDGLFWMMTNSLGIAITTFTGQNYGAGKMKRVYRGLKESLVLCAVFSAVTGVLLYYAAPVILPWFSKDAAVIVQGIVIERFFTRLYLCWVCVEVFSGVLRGMGDTLVPTLITVVGVCVLRIIWCVVMVPRKPDIVTVSWSYPVTWIIASAAFILYFFFIRKHYAMGGGHIG